MEYILAETLSVIGFIIYIIAVLQRKNKKLFRLNLLENFVNLIKNFMLGGFTAVIVQIFGTICLILKTNDKFKGLIVYVVISLQILVGLIVNNKGLLGFLPIVASSSYYFLITKIDSNIKIKILLIANLTMWIIYYIVIKDYAGAITNFGISFFTLIVVIKQYFENKHKLI